MIEDLKKEGKIAAMGISMNRWEPENGIKALETGLIDAVQVIYNIFDQAPEDRLFPFCIANDIAVIARVLLMRERLPETSPKTRFSPRETGGGLILFPKILIQVLTGQPCSVR